MTFSPRQDVKVRLANVEPDLAHVVEQIEVVEASCGHQPDGAGADDRDAEILGASRGYVTSTRRASRLDAKKTLPPLKSGGFSRKPTGSPARACPHSENLHVIWQYENMEHFRSVVAPPSLGGRAAVGLLALRAVIGVAFIFHGAPKMQHPMTWMLLGANPHAYAPGWLQAASALTEFVGGMLLVVGLLTPLVAALLFCNMSVALVAVQLPSGAPFVGGAHSYELTLVYLVAMFTFLMTGPGTLSFDYWHARSGSHSGTTLTHSRS